VQEKYEKDGYNENSLTASYNGKKTATDYFKIIPAFVRVNREEPRKLTVGITSFLVYNELGNF
jgi:hypothetical protein